MSYTEADEGNKLFSPIAVIGMAVNIPQSTSKESLWDNLINKKIAFTKFPEFRQEQIRTLLNEIDKSEFDVCAFLEDISSFDASFFRISEIEAKQMNPLHRLYLEVAWKALEDAGYAGINLSNRNIGVYVGCRGDSGSKSYIDLLKQEGISATGTIITGNVASMLPARISYLLNLNGPAMAIDTSCSSSLVSIYTASRAIMNGDCDMALAGGINLSLLPLKDQYKIGFESPSDHTRPFDKDADGTQIGEGAGVVLLKSLNKALEDGDNIYAVINGGSVNQDGRTSTITAPSLLAQEEVIDRAWKSAGLKPSSMNYMEAHGTATKLGDPIEWKALNNILKKYSNERKVCPVGSIKANIGHLLESAGVVGFIKSVLVLQNRIVPPQASFKSMNPSIDEENSFTYVNNDIVALPSKGILYAGISSFGMSGTNCHIVLSSFEDKSRKITEEEEYLFTLSAASNERLRIEIKNHIEFLKIWPHISMGSLCFTRNVGRLHLPFRMGAVIKSREELLDVLHSVINGNYNTDKVQISNTLVLPNIMDQLDLDEEASILIKKNINNSNSKDRSALLRLYVLNANIDWEFFYNNKKHRRISLPGYEFEKLIYWPDLVNGNENEDNQDVREKMLFLLKKLAGIERDEITDETELIALGIDSLILFQIIDEIKKRYSVTVEIRDFFTTLTSFGNLIAHIIKNYKSQDVPLQKKQSFKQTTQHIIREYNVEKFPFKPVLLNADTLNKKQKTFLQQFIYSYTNLTKSSRAYAAKYREILSDWINSVDYQQLFKEITYPIVSASSTGAYVIDIDGNKYIDLGIGYGASFFGNSPQFIKDAISKQMEEGFELAFQSDLAGRTAELVCELTGVDRVAFSNTGTEAIMAAMRIARAKTGKNKIVIFNGAYHGTFDGVLGIAADMNEPEAYPLSPGITPGMVDDLLVLPFGLESSIQYIAEHGSSIAAVIIEPVQSRRPGIQLPDFLKSLRSVTQKINSALIFDEIITGFRISKGGAQEYFGVYADIITYGKVIGGGMPIGLVAGKAEYLDLIDGGQWQYNDSSYPEVPTALYGGTFCKHPLTLSAMHAVLTKLKEDGDLIISGVNEKMARMADELNYFFEQKKLPIKIVYFGSLFRFEFSRELDPVHNACDVRLFFALLLYKGIYTWERRICFLSIEHSEQDIRKIIAAVKETVTEMQINGFLLIHKARESEQAIKFNLSHSQLRMWLNDLLTTERNATNLTFTYELNGKLEYTALQNTFKLLFSRHEMLRAVFFEEQDEPYQKIRPNEDINFELPLIDCSENAIENSHEQIKEYLNKKFDITSDLLLRASLFKLSENRHVLALSSHHIIMDGWSVNLFMKELGMFYQTVKKGEKENNLTLLPNTYQQYVEQENKYLQTVEFSNSVEWWKKNIGSGCELNFNSLNRSPNIRSNTKKGAFFRETLPDETYNSIKAFSKQQKTTLFVTMLSLMNALFYKLTGEKRIVIGTSVLGRNEERFFNTIGNYINTIPLINDLNGASNLTSIASTLQNNLFEAFEHQRVPLNEIVKVANLKERSKLFNVVVQVESKSMSYYDITTDIFDGLTSRPYNLHADTVEQDLYIEFCESADKLDIKIEYNLDLFSGQWIEKFFRTFVVLSNNMLSNPSMEIKECGTDEKTILANNLKPFKVKDIHYTPVSGTPYELSPAQRRLWILSQFGDGSVAYNMVGAFEIDGELNVNYLEESLRRIIKRHKSLNTIFAKDTNGDIKQYVMNDQSIDFDVERIGTNEYPYAGEINSILDKETISPFDLSIWPLIRVKLVYTSDHKYILVFTLHHIICDGWSVNVILKELQYYYNRFVTGTSEELPELSQQYYHYSNMINEKLAKGEYEDAAKFWKAQFTTEVKPIELPSVKKRPDRMSYNVEIIRYNINEKRTKELKQLAKNNRTTLFPVLLAIVDSFLYKYSGSADIVLGTPVAGRNSIELENQIGHYLNTIALRCQLSENDTLLDIISKRKQGTLNAFKYGDYPFDQLLTELNLKRDLSRSPLFDIMVVLQNVDADTTIDEFDLLGKGKIKRIQYDQSKSLFDLCFTFEENNDCISLELECNTDVFDDYRITMFKVHFDLLLSQILENPSRLIREISLLSSEERIIINKFNNTVRPFDTSDSIIKRLQKNAKTLGNAPAIYSGNIVITWNELQNRVGFISEWIIKTAGIRKGEKVGVFINRDEWLPVLLLAILDAGAIYVPIDINYPKNYINHIIEESDLKTTICDSTAIRVISGIVNGVLLTDVLSDYNPLKIYDLTKSTSTEADAAAILFTSGSTGKPKGVRVLQKGIHSLLTWAEEEYRLSQVGIVYALTSISFDLSIYELFFPVWIGKPLRILSGALEVQEHSIIDKDILLNTVPSIIERFIKEGFNFSNITVLNMAGEMVPAYFKQRLDYKRIEIRNLYGPTEYSVYSTVYLFEDNTNGIKIGKPLNNTKVYLLDEYQMEVSVGFIGELYLTGQGLAGGYENDKERTEKAFLRNPFDNGNYKTMYRTGDFARLLPDGQLDLIGRQDNQTKIQGYRVELIEIENALTEFSDVEKSVVTIVNSKELSEKKLLAYIKKKQNVENGEEKTLFIEHEIYENEGSIDDNMRRSLLHEFNTPGYKYDFDEAIVTKFETLAEKYSNKIAVRFEKQSLSYEQLNKKANKIAHSILEKGAIKQDDIIAILMERSDIMMASIIGIWKTGAAYLPIDPKYPIDRIKELIVDSKAKMILAEDDSVWKNQINVAECEIFSANIFSNNPNVLDTNPKIFISLSALAYVIYTSGSTGKPKGVMIEHLGMLNHINAKINELKIDENSIVAQNATHCFDISIWQMFAGLISGGKTIVYSYETVLDPEMFLKELNFDKVSVLELVPSYFAEMLAIMEDFPKQRFLDNLSIIVLNAETLMPDLVKRWFDIYPNCPIVNTYGATEVSDDTSHYIMHELPAMATIPVMKRPISNFKIYIVDQNLKLVPIGEVGEILISGPCVGRGYINDEERTKAVFIDDPFRPGTRAYRTGDLGKYLNDGTMEFIGRKDSQVKVSGHRVELGEIQHVLVKIEQINEAIVIAVADSQKKNTICAYYTLLKSKLIDESDIKKELQRTLPEYMMPSYFQRMEKFPLNENGKVDKKKLPNLLINDSNKDFIEELRTNISRKLPFYMQPAYYTIVEDFPMTPNGKIDRKALSNLEGIVLTGSESYVSPRTMEEKELLEIWKKLLNTDKISIHTNFFDIGGNSLKLIGLFKQINKNFPNTFRVPDLFEFATIEKQAKKIEQINGKNTADVLEEVEF
jgi:amino acid adenylation domain-containing protein